MAQEKIAKGERLQVVLARFGVASRRGVVSLIEEGKVTVNGEVIREKGHRVFAAKDKITVEGREFELETSQEKRYFMLNKPKGVMTTMQDPHAEHTVADFFKDVSARLFPVGRLDRDTTGLVLMINDGELAYRLTHPKFGVAKTYRVKVMGAVLDQRIQQLEQGVVLEEGRTAPCQIRVEEKTPKVTVMLVTLHEGKKRQIRRVFEKIGHRVIELERLSYGPLVLGELRWGDKRELKPHEVRQLEEATGIRKKQSAPAAKKSS